MEPTGALESTNVARSELHERPLTFQLEQDYLFKYCDARGIDILQSLRLKVTPPNEFNDPFEFLPKVDFSIDADDVTKWMTDREMLHKLWRDGGRTMPFADFQTVCESRFGNPSPDQIERTRKTFEEISISERDGVVDFISQTHALACYSEVSDHVLMWSHYTRGHRGIVVEFNLKSPFFSGLSGAMPINYRSERTSARFDKHGFRFDEHVLSVVRTKSLSWSYEREWRQLFKLQDCTKVHTPDGRIEYYKNISGDVINSIIFGVRPETERIVRELVTRDDLKHVRLWRARLHEREFRLKIDAVKES
jgi:hypothetical protein